MTTEIISTQTLTGESPISWITCKLNSNYEIADVFPYQVRKRDGLRIVVESVDRSIGYVICYLNSVKFLKHRLIANQFLGLDLENKKLCVDHINGVKTDNRLENLRIATTSENNLNRSNYMGYIYEFVDEILAEAIVVDTYGDWKFENLYFHDDIFYRYNGVRYRKLRICETKAGNKCVNMLDIYGKTHSIYYTKFKLEYDLE